MKKNTTFLVAFFLTNSCLFAQNGIQRKMVLLETITSFSFQSCIGTAIGIDELVENDHNIAVINWHFIDSLETNASNNRVSFYPSLGSHGNIAIPSNYMDGTDQFVSFGSASFYSTYLEHYQDAIEKLTPIDLEVNLSVFNHQVYVEAIATLVDTLSPATQAGLNIVSTESHLAKTWFSLDELNFVQREKYVGFGTPNSVFDFSDATKDTLNFDFGIDPSLALENVEMVIFIQDPITYEVFNAIKFPTTRFDAELRPLKDKIFCERESSLPGFFLKNLGWQRLLVADIEYSINGSSFQSYSWNGNLTYFEDEYVLLPLGNVQLNDGLNSMTVIVKNLNGNPDQIPANDTLQHFWQRGSAHHAGQYSLKIQPDLLGNQITWHVLNPTLDVVASGGPYTIFDTSLVTEQFSLGATPGCYEFRIFDAGRDGLTSSPTAFYSLEDPTGNVVIESIGGDYGSMEGGRFEVSYPTAIKEELAEHITVSPNPAWDQFEILLSDNAFGQVKLEVFTMSGKRIWLGAIVGNQSIVDLGNYPSGLYLLKVITDDAIFWKKIKKR